MKFIIEFTKSIIFALLLFLFIACTEEGSTNPSKTELNLKYLGNFEFENATIYTATDTSVYNYGFSIKLNLDSLGNCYYQEGMQTGGYYTFDGKWKYDNNSIIVTDDKEGTYNMQIISYNENFYELPDYTLAYTVDRDWYGEQAKVKYTIKESFMNNLDKKLIGKWDLKGMNKKYENGNEIEVDLDNISFYSYTLNIGQNGNFREDSIVSGSTVIFTGYCDVMRGRLVLHNDIDTKIGPYSVNDSILSYKNRIIEDGKEVIISYTFKKE
ncbi:MAG: hypothetical protein WC313_07455 [Candidatus Kapaibacterium sp.]